MTLLVKNVTENLIEKKIAIESEKFRAFGIDWQIKADISESYGNKFKYVELCLWKRVIREWYFYFGCINFPLISYNFNRIFEVDFEFIVFYLHN